ncbi:hypothetical protein FB451DRAFT_1363824 [Mycena latifolia]|nr:hypothetical protein FB451DRAFT_1363824 [Mycena latifolia]
MHMAVVKNFDWISDRFGSRADFKNHVFPSTPSQPYFKKDIYFPFWLGLGTNCVRKVGRPIWGADRSSPTPTQRTTSSSRKRRRMDEDESRPRDGLRLDPGWPRGFMRKPPRRRRVWDKENERRVLSADSPTRGGTS